MSRSTRSLAFGGLPLLAALAGLASVLPPDSFDAASVPTLPSAGEADRFTAVMHAEDPDFYTDIRPLLIDNCMGCHGPEGPGWSMADPEATWEERRLVAAMVTERLMPPWIAEAGHQDYVGDPTLSDEEIETVRLWREAGFPKGEPREDSPAASGERNEGSGSPGLHEGFEPDLSLDVLPGGEYLPNQDAPDDYRCFVVDWPEEERRFITGFRAVPGNLGVAHHVVVYSVASELADRFRELDEAEEGSGYQCFGGAIPDRLGSGSERLEYEERYPDGLRELNAGNFWLAHWAPGMDGHVFPEGTGIPVAPGSAIVVQMHYYGRDAPGEADAGTRLEFQHADRVDRPAFHFPQTNGEWLAAERNGSMVIQPGSTDSWEVSDELEAMLPYIGRVTGVSPERIDALEIHSANLHMHAFGHSGRISLHHSDGTRETLLSVPRWDLRWQRDFTFVEPKVFVRDELAGVTLATECTFRNPTTEPVYGGYGSYDEMCFNFSYIAVQPTDSTDVADDTMR